MAKSNSARLVRKRHFRPLAGVTAKAGAAGGKTRRQKGDTPSRHAEKGYRHRKLWKSRPRGTRARAVSAYGFCGASQVGGHWAAAGGDQEAAAATPMMASAIARTLTCTLVMDALLSWMNDESKVRAGYAHSRHDTTSPSLGTLSLPLAFPAKTRLRRFAGLTWPEFRPSATMELPARYCGSFEHA